MKPTDSEKQCKSKEIRRLGWSMANGCTATGTTANWLSKCRLWEFKLQRHPGQKDQPTGETRCKQEVGRVGVKSTMQVTSVGTLDC